ncbi:PD-(D/E)XK nuclease family protein [Magnetococcus sp. PR-3]|uniref:PD-(D/E)XK nuclease family protein n=1 Tax=Magnetococcus sp. PR-3 TaxID=3120355 RepID=UPI002FCE0567
MNASLADRTHEKRGLSLIVGESELFTALDEGAVVVTVNRRLSRWLRHRHGEAKMSAGLTAWPTPDLLAWGAWLERSWRESVASHVVAAKKKNLPRLINGEQERLLWSAVVRQSEVGQGLLSPQGAADAARQAWGLMAQWCVDLRQLGQQPEPESQVLLQWITAYQQRLQEEGLLDLQQLPQRLQADGETWSAPEQLILAGFDEISPQIHEFLDFLQNKGVRVSQWQPETVPPQQCGQRIYADQQQELLAMACWVRHKLEQGSRNIGVVVPNLPELRGAIARLLAAVLTPGSVRPDKPAAELAVNISSGTSLSHAPVVADALLMLQFMHRPVEPPVWAALLRSPYLGGHDEQKQRNWRGRLEATLRGLGCFELDRDQMCQIMEQQGMVENSWYRKLRQLQQPEGAMAQALPLGRWAARVSQWLEQVGWPGGTQARPLNSREYQAVTAWADLLTQWAALEHTAPALSWDAALGLLQGMAQRRDFQPDGGEAPVRVMGVLESAGESFDALWLLDMRDEVWPPAPMPNPFLPLTLQRTQQMPRASAERELAFARQITQRLNQSAQEMVVSWCRSDGDRDFQISPLFAELPLDTRTEPDYLLDAQHIAQSAQWHTYDGAQGSEVTQEPDTPLPGGSALPKAQAACPFQAFAKYRLRAKAMEVTAPGADGMRRGTLAHAMLAAFWMQVQTEENLRTAGQAQRQIWVDEAVDQALSQWSSSASFVDLEKQRLQRLMGRWIEVELARPPGFVVEATEQQQNLTIAGALLTLRLDRLDRLADGRHLLVDYKSGKPNSRVWQGARPEDPQLPLYTLAPDVADVAGLAFASLKSSSGDQPWIGIAEEADLIPGLKGWDDRRAKLDVESWPHMLAQWRTTLTTLVEDFLAGRVAVDPNEGEKGCSYCDLSPLCRKDQLSQGEVPDGVG